MMMLALISLVISVLSQNADGYTTCTSSAYKSRKYTFKVDISTYEKVWSHCEFPNPLFDLPQCGRNQTSVTHYVCDPDYMLGSVSEGESIDLALYRVQTYTSTVCTDPDGQKQSYIVTAVILNRMRMPDFQSADLCINDCGELHPELYADNVRTATDDEQGLLMEHFADQVRQLWAIGACGNDILILYSQELNKVFISAGYKAKYFLTDSKRESLSTQLLSYINENRLAEGLLSIAEELKYILQPITPAHILLIIGVSASILVSLVLVFFLFFVERDMNVFGSNLPMKFIGWVIYVITGVWVVKATLVISMYISHKFPHVSAGITLIGFFGLIGLYLREILT